MHTAAILKLNLIMLSLGPTLLIRAPTEGLDISGSGVLHPACGISYNSAIQSQYRHVVCNVPVSCKANGDLNQVEAWLDSDPIAEKYRKLPKFIVFKLF